MTEEFNLSEKIFYVDVASNRGSKRLLREKCRTNSARIRVKDVKKFIKLLKGLSRKIKGAEGDWVNLEVIKEHAGEDLST